ncbi:hypothetical protein LO80_03235 [Candidatus Francisella endociliophora]|uniref:Uncharacterized protein n=1 Tax=Candidatus Francisella endociliophora TaxID=653937 RepID=A0A097END9_9GAMM|nr:hypothetical protein [Francisella sp. FSC1006]AIT09081.1 hypothetical protein LO80_03235 [Francisella sp. FSC1006]
MSALDTKLDELTNFIEDNLVGNVYFNDYDLDTVKALKTFINVDISLDGPCEQKTLLSAGKKAKFTQGFRVTFYLYSTELKYLSDIFKMVNNVNYLLNKRSLYPQGFRLTNKIVTPHAIVDGRLGAEFNNYIIECFFELEYIDQVY